MCLKDADGVKNSDGPDQTASQGMNRSLCINKEYLVLLMLSFVIFVILILGCYKNITVLQSESSIFIRSMHA